MLTKLLGKRAMIYLTIEKADKNFEGWAKLSYSDIARESYVPVVNSARYVADQMARDGYLEKTYNEVERCHYWRVNPNLISLMEAQDNE